MSAATVMNSDGIEKIRKEIHRLQLHAAFLESGAPKLNDIILKELKSALERTAGNRTYAAEQLGISIRTIRNWIKEYGLEDYA